jgi:hydrophobe/amphiphile efflux-1 (HAE1) family protein/NodT family efflux transporter outer membrane factor (OMF) lipoprotein
MDYFFVRRPTVAIVISIVLVIFGLVALRDLPISQYPEVVPPEIQVNSSYTGADAVAVEQSVTTPLEQKINGVENMIYMRSINANDGTSSIRVSFTVGSDLDMSNVLVQNRVSEGQPSLPEEVKRLGVTVKKSLSFPLTLVTLRSPKGTYDNSYLNNYASININDAIARISGVGQVTLFGGSDYAMRIWVKPDQLATLGITVGDISKAIQAQNVIAPAGQFGGPPAPPKTEFSYVARLAERLSLPEQFGQVIIKSNPDGSQVRVRDVARVELGTQLYNAVGRFNGDPSAVLAIYQTPGSNALEVVQNVRKTMEDLKQRFPDDIEYTVSLDTTAAVSAGIEEIKHTLVEAMVLVILVVFIFLQNWRATLIPILTVPVSLIATFSVFPLLGFSINTLSLLGLVLAIGIVVDDAIVVVEAVMHHIEHGKSPREATVQAMKEVAAPVIAITLILSSVFIPVVFMGGISGQFYMQFAVTIAISVLFSALGALTLSPALSSLLLKPATPAKGLLGKFYAGFNRLFEVSTNWYVSLAGGLARRIGLSLAIFALIMVAILFFGKSLPLGFVPEEDQGYILATVQLPDASSLQRSDEAAKNVERLIMDTAGVESVTTVTGFSLLTQAYASNTAFFFVTLKPWSDRPTAEEQANGIIKKLNGLFAQKVTQGSAFAFGPPAIPGLGTGSGFSMFLQDRSGQSPQYLAEQSLRFIEAAQKRPEIGRISTVYRASVPQIYFDVDRDKLYKQGIALADINQSLGVFLGGGYVNDFNRFGRLYKVYLQAEAEYRDSPDDLQVFHVRSADGTMVPLSSVLSTKKIEGPEYTNRFNLYRAVELIGTSGPGYSSAQTLKALEEVAKEVLPPEMGYAWNAMSYQEATASGGMEVFLLSMLFVFLILAAQYESWGLPFSVLLGTPFAVLGALGGLWLARGLLGDSYLNNIFAQIGILTLVGLAAKNAILIVEFARMKKDEGMPLMEAVLEAARLRFRPILMTAFAFILGVVPLLTATGAGAEGRKVIGMAVFSGMLIATILGVLLVPMLYVLVEKLSAGQKKATASAAACLAVFFLLSGCTLGPAYERPNLGVSEVYHEKAPLSGVEIANLPWWEFFPDSELKGLISTALENNTDLARATARIDQARAILGVTRADQFPRLDASGGAARTDNSDNVLDIALQPQNDFGLFGNLSFELDLWGRLRSATEARRAELLSTEYGRRSVVISVVTATGSLYFSLLDLDNRMAIARRTLENRKGATSVIRARFEKGVVAELDLNQAQIEEADAAITLISLEREQRQVENALNVVLGQPSRTIARGIPLQQQRLQGEIPLGVPAQLLERRPDVRASEESLKAAVARIGVAEAERLPTFSLLGFVGLRARETNEIFDRDSFTWSIGGDFIGPLLDFGKSASVVDAAKAQAAEALANYEATVLRAVQEVEDSAVAIRTLDVEYQQRVKQTQAAANATRLSRARYDDGMTSYLEVLDVERSLFSAELGASFTRQQYFASIIRMYGALGGGWEVGVSAAVPVSLDAASVSAQP